MYFFQLSVWDDEISSIPKITIFLAKSLQKLHKPSPWNAIPHFMLILTVPNKQFFSEKLLLGLCDQVFNSWAMYKFKINLLYNQ